MPITTAKSVPKYHLWPSTVVTGTTQRAYLDKSSLRTSDHDPENHRSVNGGHQVSMKRQSKNFIGEGSTEQPNPTTSEPDEPLFFYMPDAVYGEFCQWYPSRFTVSKSQMSSLVGHSIGETGADAESCITFTCAEHFMMYCKAGRFHDTETQRRVLATASPKEQKRLGKLTVGFTDDSWDEVKNAVVVAGNIAKFGQNPKLKRKLLATGDRMLVEAASRDRIWGIGYTAKHAMSHR